MSLENEDPFIIVKNSTEAEYRAFIEETLEDEMIFTKIEINKTLADGHFSIYRYQKFVEDIVGLSMEDVLKTFSMFLDGAGKNIVFELFDSPNIFIRKQCIFFLWGIERLIVILAGHSVCWLVGIIRTFITRIPMDCCRMILR